MFHAHPPPPSYTPDTDTDDGQNNDGGGGTADNTNDQDKLERQAVGMLKDCWTLFSVMQITNSLVFT